MNIPIVVAAYNRPASLKRLLESLSKADYQSKSNIHLIISIDYSGDTGCRDVAEEFEWAFGQKKVLVHPKRLGLREHIIRCGDIALDYDGVLILEDDLVVSPFFYRFAMASSDYYADKDYVAGISLYGYERNEFCDMPFSPIANGSDIYFMKAPSSWGEIFLKKHWIDFKKSYDNGIVLEETDFLPNWVKNNWPETSWKKLYFKHMISIDAFFVYPMQSYSSNMGEIGTHYFSDSSYLKTSLSLQKKDFRFINLEDTINVYDQFMEWYPHFIKRKEVINNNWNDIEIDIYASKPLKHIKKTKIITSRKVTESEGQVSLSIRPVQLNLLFNIVTKTDFHNSLNIAKIENVIDDSSPIREYFANCISPSIKRIFFRKGVDSIKKSIVYRTGYFLLWPMKIVLLLFPKLQGKIN